MLRLPSLNAVRAFEAAARHESFTRAADELSVTQGAVSHQVKALEAELGVALFRRTANGLVLTEAGRAYRVAVRDGLERIVAGTEALTRGRRTKVLTVSMSPNFAAKWLVPRIGAFVADHPEIDLRLSAALHHVDFGAEEVDMAIRHGAGVWPHLRAVRLYEEVLFPVCSPALVAGEPPLRAPADIVRHTLLHLDDRADWLKWLRAAGVEGADLERGPVFNQASLAIDAAVDGQGIALSRTALAARDLLAGRLVRPFGPDLAVGYGYYVVCPERLADDPKVAIFRDWLLAEAAAERAALAALLKLPDR